MANIPCSYCDRSDLPLPFDYPHVCARCYRQWEDDERIENAKLSLTNVLVGFIIIAAFWWLQV